MIKRIKQKIKEADAIIIGAGAGLSTSAGFIYNGENFRRYFADFEEKYGFHDMYSGGFYPYKTVEEHWAYWSRYVYVNRYMDAPLPIYENLLELVKEKDYFVITTNVDHCFQKAGFDKDRLFYTQGDYGLFQCSKPCCNETFDNEEMIKNMVCSQGYTITEDGKLEGFEGANLKREIPTDLVPYCPHCGEPMSMNLRADHTFVQDNGWDMAADRYEKFLQSHKNSKVVFLELGVGYNTPGIIKYPFWHYTYRWPDATYICLNLNDAGAPSEISDRSICLKQDIGDVLELLKR